MGEKREGECDIDEAVVGAVAADAALPPMQEELGELPPFGECIEE